MPENFEEETFDEDKPQWADTVEMYPELEEYYLSIDEYFAIIDDAIEKLKFIFYNS